MHRTLSGVFKNQIDWMPTGLMNPRKSDMSTSVRTCAALQINGYTRTSNVVNDMRKIARFLYMPCCRETVSVGNADTQFDEFGRMKESRCRQSVVALMQEFYKFTRSKREERNYIDSKGKFSHQGRSRDQGKRTPCAVDGH
eukprot:gnl/MRDRNA2_/MRDRNA2_72344_c0_seq2.p1 gnl/MRDRNA2_/MRDRNA2_72344_c0~~gnl/MRDRNA2_/MRDRNA2_72344_c0_seq2.p1  ORF type:complete len:148 (+),score=21.93 gnl/MRDRNA2_/MRDRNA2_72344_c0_seq2:24-446(+)